MAFRKPKRDGSSGWKDGGGLAGLLMFGKCRTPGVQSRDPQQGGAGMQKDTAWATLPVPGRHGRETVPQLNGMEVFILERWRGPGGIIKKMQAPRGAIPGSATGGTGMQKNAAWATLPVPGRHGRETVPQLNGMEVFILERWTGQRTRG